MGENRGAAMCIRVWVCVPACVCPQQQLCHSDFSGKRRDSVDHPVSPLYCRTVIRHPTHTHPIIHPISNFILHCIAHSPLHIDCMEDNLQRGLSGNNLRRESLQTNRKASAYTQQEQQLAVALPAYSHTTSI